MKCKCQGCELRHLGCHDKCPDYQAYRQALDEKNEAIKKQKEEEYWASLFGNLERQSRRHRK